MQRRPLPCSTSPRQRSLPRRAFRIRGRFPRYAAETILLARQCNTAPGTAEGRPREPRPAHARSLRREPAFGIAARMPGGKAAAARDLRRTRSREQGSSIRSSSGGAIPRASSLGPARAERPETPVGRRSLGVDACGWPATGSPARSSSPVSPKASRATLASASRCKISLTATYSSSVLRGAGWTVHSAFVSICQIMPAHPRSASNVCVRYSWHWESETPSVASESSMISSGPQPSCSIRASSSGSPRSQ